MDFKKDRINMVDGQTAKKTVFATGIGNAMEWFDFGVYAYTTAYIGANFFRQYKTHRFNKYLYLQH